MDGRTEGNQKWKWRSDEALNIILVSSVAIYAINGTSVDCVVCALSTVDVLPQ